MRATATVALLLMLAAVYGQATEQRDSGHAGWETSGDKRPDNAFERALGLKLELRF